MMRFARLLACLFPVVLASAGGRAETTVFFNPDLRCGVGDSTFDVWQAEAGNSILETFESANAMDPVRDGYRLSSGAVLYRGGWSVGRQEAVLEITFAKPGTDDPVSVYGAIVSLFNFGLYGIRAHNQAGDLLAEVTDYPGCESLPHWVGFLDPEGIFRIEVEHTGGLGAEKIANLAVAAAIPDPDAGRGYLDTHRMRFPVPAETRLASVAVGNGVTVAT